MKVERFGGASADGPLYGLVQQVAHLVHCSLDISEPKGASMMQVARQSLDKMFLDPSGPTSVAAQRQGTRAQDNRAPDLVRGARLAGIMSNRWHRVRESHQGDTLKTRLSPDTLKTSK